MSPDEVAEVLVQAVQQNRFFILAEPAHHETLLRRTADWNAFLEGRLAALL